MNELEFINSVSSKDEQWKHIVGWENYLVSNYGNIIALPRKLKRGISKIRLLKQTKNVQKHNHIVLFVRLYDGTRSKNLLVHRLVANAFIPNPYNKPQIDHIDANTLNNHVSNLRWCTSKENMNNPITRKKMSDIMKIKHSHKYYESVFKKNNKLSKSILQIKDGFVINEYPSMSEAQRNGFLQSKISECCLLKRKSHKGFQWKFQTNNNINKSKNESSDAES